MSYKHQAAASKAKKKRGYADGGVVETTPLPKADPRGYAPRQKYMDGSDVWPSQPTRKKSYYDEMTVREPKD